jgi:hypothetical protein
VVVMKNNAPSRTCVDGGGAVDENHALLILAALYQTQLGLALCFMNL